MVIIGNNEEGEMIKCKLVTDYKEMRFECAPVACHMHLP